MHASLTRGERWAIAVVLGLVAVWLVLPPIQQPQEYHEFADERVYFGIPYAADVLSNAAFALAGLYGGYMLWHGTRRLRTAVRASLAMFFAGLVLTAFGSAYYHWSPDDATLVLDRLPMTMVFAGVIGGIVGERLSERSGAALLVLSLAAGIASVLYWMRTDDVSAYALVQFGGFGALLVLLMVTRPGPEALPWWSLVGWYGLAKVFELADGPIWEISGGLMAGHLLKHVAAAMGGVVLAFALRTPAPVTAPSESSPRTRPE